MAFCGVYFANDTKPGSVIGQARTHQSSAVQQERFQRIHNASLQGTSPQVHSVRASLIEYSPSAATSYGTGATHGSSHRATQALTGHSHSWQVIGTGRPLSATAGMTTAHVLPHSVTQAPSQQLSRHQSSAGSGHPMHRHNLVPPEEVKKNYDLLAAGGGMPPRGSLGTISVLYQWRGY